MPKNPGMENRKEDHVPTRSYLSVRMAIPGAGPPWEAAKHVFGTCLNIRELRRSFRNERIVPTRSRIGTTPGRSRVPFRVSDPPFMPIKCEASTIPGHLPAGLGRNHEPSCPDARSSEHPNRTLRHQLLRENLICRESPTPMIVFAFEYAMW